MSTASEKRKRASRACDFCHGRGLKCRRNQTTQSREEPGCLTCKDYGVSCTANRLVRKRGRKPKVINTHASEREPAGGISDLHSMHTIRLLVRIYRDTMYQCYFPFLPEKDLESRWKYRIPNPEEPSYMVLMALCAVSANTAELNAVFDESLLHQELSIPDSEEYFLEATSKIPLRFPKTQDFDYLRAFGLLTLYSLQRSNNSDLQLYLGRYHALVAEYGFHDESRWPSNISLSEVDDRRRLFWCVYRLEIHSGVVFGHAIRLPEAQASVLYPRTTPAMDPETQAWTVGWDYITDLFRFMEYALFSLRTCKSRKAVLAVLCDRPSPTTLLDSLAQIKASKPRALTGLREPDSHFQSNRCRYMAVQIRCTEALATIMALLYCQAPAREVTDFAEGFLQELTSAPLIMFKVASNQIVHQLLGVGHMLSNASRYDNGQYKAEAKRLLAFLGDLVKNLESVIPAAAAAGDRLLMLKEAIA